MSKNFKKRKKAKRKLGPGDIIFFCGDPNSDFPRDGKATVVSFGCLSLDSKAKDIYYAMVNVPARDRLVYNIRHFSRLPGGKPLTPRDILV